MDQQQVQQMAAGFIGIFMLIALVIYAAMIFLYWRILVKAGFSGWLSLLVLVPGIGAIIPLCILAFGDWKVIPAPVAQLYPPHYPPPPPPAYTPQV